MSPAKGIDEAHCFAVGVEGDTRLTARDCRADHGVPADFKTVFALEQFLSGAAGGVSQDCPSLVNQEYGDVVEIETLADKFGGFHNQLVGVDD